MAAKLMRRCAEVVLGKMVLRRRLPPNAGGRELIASSCSGASGNIVAIEADSDAVALLIRISRLVPPEHAQITRDRRRRCRSAGRWVERVEARQTSHLLRRFG